MSINRTHRDLSEDDDFDVPVPAMREKPYYLKRIERKVGGRSGYGLMDMIKRFDLDTIKLIDAHPRPHDITAQSLRDLSEDGVRSILSLIAADGNNALAFDDARNAYKVLIEHHELDQDVTSLHEVQQEMVAAAARFLVKTKLYEFAPPRLTHFVMGRREDTDDIIAYVTERVGRNEAHSIDLDALEDYLDADAQPLREGRL